MANEARGEFDIELEGITYGMRPTHEAIEAFEKATGKGILVLAGAAADQSLTTSEMAAIVAECCRAYGRSLGEDAVPEQRAAAGFKADAVRPLLVDAGILIVMVRLKLMLWLAATGGVTASGEVKATPTSPTTG